MSEEQMWTALRPSLKGLDPVRIENSLALGTPDVNYTEGWIELKNVDKRPKKEETRIEVDHFTQDQRMWIARRHQVAGRVHLLLRIEKTWLLFEPPNACIHVGNSNEAELRTHAFAIWENVPDRVALLAALRGTPPSGS